MKLLLPILMQLTICWTALYGEDKPEHRFKNCEKSFSSVVNKDVKDQDFLSNSREYMTHCGGQVVGFHRALLLNRMGQALVDTKEYSEAIPLLLEARDLAHKSGVTAVLAWSWEELGRASALEGSCDAAITAFKAAVDLPTTDNLTLPWHKSAQSWLEFLEGPDVDHSTVKCRWIKQSAQLNSGENNNNSYGTAFYVSDKGVLLTNNHVVSGCRTLTLAASGTILRLISRDQRDDLALLQANDPAPSFVRFRSGKLLDVGEPVIAFGFPLPGTLSSSGVATNGIVSSLTGFRSDPRTLQFSAAIQPGNSGGPLFDASGHVIGIVEAKLDAFQMSEDHEIVPENVGFAIQWSQIKPFLESEGVTPVREVSTVTLPATDISSIARNVSVAVDCVR